MGLKHEFQVEIQSPAEKFFAVMTTPQLISSMSPDHITGVTVHEGHEHAHLGGIKRWDTVIHGKPEHVVEKVIALDEKNLSVTYELIDGDLIKNHYKTFISTLVVTSLPAGGSLVTWTYDYEKRTEDAPDGQMYESVLVNMTKDIDAHLLATST